MVREVPVYGVRIPRGSLFPTTHWSAIHRARERDDGQLALLCERYRQPVQGYLRALGHSPHDAEDHTQNFFARLLHPGFLDPVEPDKGRFRWFLLSTLKHHLIDHRKAAGARKRGGGVWHEPIDGESGETGAGRHLPSGLSSPDRAYDEAWARAVVSTAWRRLRSEAEGLGRLALFEGLTPLLLEEATAPDYRTLAVQLGISEGALRIAALRLRRRLAGLVREEIAATLGSREDLEEELRYLRSLFARVR